MPEVKMMNHYGNVYFPNLLNSFFIEHHKKWKKLIELHQSDVAKTKKYILVGKNIPFFYPNI